MLSEKIGWKSSCYVQCTCTVTTSLFPPLFKSHTHAITPSHPHTVTSDPSLQVRACNLLGGYLTHKETNMRYLSLETLSHLATSDLSREAVKKHQDIVLNSLKVSV